MDWLVLVECAYYRCTHSCRKYYTLLFDSLNSPATNYIFVLFIFNFFLIIFIIFTIFLYLYILLLFVKICFFCSCAHLLSALLCSFIMYTLTACVHILYTVLLVRVIVAVAVAAYCHVAVYAGSIVALSFHM